MFGTSLSRLFRDESAATAVEYGLIVAIVAVLAIAGLDTLGVSIRETVSTANSGMKVD